MSYTASGYRPDLYQTVITAKDDVLPVSLAQAKEHCRVLLGDHDEYIETLLEAAVDYCESVTGRALRESMTVVQRYWGWPCGPIRFDRQPVKSITSIEYYDAAGDLQEVDVANYRLHGSTEALSYIEFDSEFLSPDLFVRDDALAVTYEAGYDSIADVPARAKHAIKLLIGHWFEHGEAVNIGNITSEVPMATNALLDSLSTGMYR